MPDQRRGGKKAKSKRLAQASSQNVNQNLKFIALALLFAAIAALCYQYLEYLEDWTGPLRLGSPWQIEENNEDHNIFTVVDIAGKGKGLVAARDIKQGELVIREGPLFVVPRHIKSSPSDLIAGKVKKLGRKERKAFLSLSYANFPSHLNPQVYPEEVALAIFSTNAVAAGDDEVGIFPRMARLNHGCASAFNVVYTWRESEKALFLFALRDIHKGDELLTTYTTTRKPRDERRAFLSKQYGFNCTCAVCALPEPLSKASDQRLMEMSRRYENFKTWGGEIDGVEAIQHIRKIWEIGEEEGYWSERGQLAADAAWIAASHSDATATQAWARKAVEWFSYEIGMDTSHVMDMSNIVERPQGHRAWGTRDRAEVGGP
ncbi:SET domain-containing protein [Phlegmacium glaucopus]|nr:SET domain-containing protein [Phlegmacium glaucopus]